MLNNDHSVRVYNAVRLPPLARSIPANFGGYPEETVLRDCQPNLHPITNMMNVFSIARLPILLASAVVFSTAQGQILWNESSSGDLSNNQSAPSPFTLANGMNAVIGTVGGADSQDWITLTVPAGLQLSSVTLAAYSSVDVQGFTGVQRGTAFVGSPFTESSYLGYAHFGTAADNGPFPPANLVGVDILP